jgi:hypothetical protein
MSISYHRVAMVGAAFCFASLVTIAAARADSDPAKEMATAATHAGLAAKAADMKMTQMHLHHVINCLVGPNGKGFDAAPGNPCKDQGNGAISDTKDPKQKKAMQAALSKANAGLKAKDMAAAQKDATQAQALLTPKT